GLAQRERGTALPVDPHRPHRLGGHRLHGTAVDELLRGADLGSRDLPGQRHGSVTGGLGAVLLRHHRDPDLPHKSLDRRPSVATAMGTTLGVVLASAISPSRSFIVSRSPDAHHSGHVSTMAQGFGCLIAGLGPFGLGGLHTATVSWTAPLLALIILLVFQLVIGAFASQDRHVRARSAHTREVVLRG